MCSYCCSGAAFDDAGNIYYSSYLAMAVYKVTPAGDVNQFKNQLANYGQGIARDAATGNFWVGGFGNADNLLLLDATGATLSTFTVDTTLWALASHVDATGAAYYTVSDAANALFSIKKMTQAGVETTLVSQEAWTGCCSPYSLMGMDIDPVNGFIYAAPGNPSGGIMIRRWNLDGTGLTVVSDTSFPLQTNNQIGDWGGIGVDETTGTLYANYYDKVTFRKTFEWLANGTGTPSVLTYGDISSAPYLVTRDGTLYGGKNFKEPLASGMAEATFPYWSNAAGLAGSPDGRFFVSERTQGRIYVSTPDPAAANYYTQSVFMSGLSAPGELCGVRDGKLFYISLDGARVFFANTDGSDCGTAVDSTEGRTFTACTLDAGGSGNIILASSYTDNGGGSSIHVLTSAQTPYASLDQLPNPLNYEKAASETNIVTGVAGDTASSTFFMFHAGLTNANGAWVKTPALKRAVGSNATPFNLLGPELFSSYAQLPIQFDAAGDYTTILPLYAGASIALPLSSELLITASDGDSQFTMTALSNPFTASSRPVSGLCSKPGASRPQRLSVLQRPGQQRMQPLQASASDVSQWLSQGLISDHEAKNFSPTQLEFMARKRAGGGSPSPPPPEVDDRRAQLQRAFESSPRDTSSAPSRPSSRPSSRQPSQRPSPYRESSPAPSSSAQVARPSSRPSSRQPSQRPSPYRESSPAPSSAPAPAARPSSSRPSSRSPPPRPTSKLPTSKGNSGGRWRGMDADMDASDDQQDIARGRDMVDSLFQGFGSGIGGTHNAVLSSTEYLSTAARNFNNIEDGFYISPAFLDKISIHVSKNFLDLPKIKIPLILGIWGGKGQGKTFQCNLAYKKLGIAPIVMSAGELESGNAGEPAKLIRQRYREASDVVKKGKMCSLFINDLDAGAGRMGDATQYTVNNQMVNATLMNIADNPTNVQLPGVYKNEEIPRVPVVCTGNDFSTLYAPLIRDGRMEKYYWNPTREDRVGVCMGIFQHDNVDRADVERLVDAFPGQSIDFFGAIRARVYDDKVHEWITSMGVENIGKRLLNSKEGKVTFDKPSMDLNTLMKYGNMLVEEQENVKRVQLADEYMSGASLAGTSGSSLPEAYKTGGLVKRKSSLLS
ncbi:hypothetical protein D9Q98_010593 [Chlorella vulgaris]|uniref:Ribulose bisphosphate carboxylase/oxygenase activase, chloroplastic n=1 Tax=Chlorella vulgaris TaxID=3077 RepID=A0A9D4TQR6_CHLVU|nr:hypothetical protein D9Q98_010593 [Chlorella vulgaris]